MQIRINLVLLPYLNIANEKRLLLLRNNLLSKHMKTSPCLKFQSSLVSANVKSFVKSSTKMILVYSRLFHELLQPIDYCLRRFKNCWNWFILRKKKFTSWSQSFIYLPGKWMKWFSSIQKWVLKWIGNCCDILLLFKGKFTFFSKNNHTVSLKGYITTRNTHIRQTVIVFGRICDSSV